MNATKIFFLFHLLVFGFLLFSNRCDAQSTNDKFNLNFNTADPPNFKWKLANIIVPKKDSTEVFNSKYPIRFDGNETFFRGKSLNIDLFQQFILPSSLRKSEIEVSIHNKSTGMDSLKLNLSGIDKYGNTTKTSSIDIMNNDKWEVKTLKTDFDSIEYFMINITGTGFQRPVKGNKLIPRVYIDRMSITIDGKDINGISGINSFTDRAKMDLNPAYIYQIPATSTEKNIIEGIHLDHKKIVALGETVHGSKEINENGFQIIKNAVLHNNCKLILMELELAESLKYNLFIQNKLNEGDSFNITEEACTNHLSVSAFKDLLYWLKDYNSTASRKVVFLGLLDVTTLPKVPLFDFIYTFYEEKEKDLFLPLLDALYIGTSKEALGLVSKNTERLKNILGEDNFFFFYHTLENLAAIEVGEKKINNDNYDYHMWLNAQTFIAEYPKDKETVMIYTHYVHAKKREGAQGRDPNSATMGRYLENYFKEDYSVVGLTVGTGKITTRKVNKEFTDASLEEMIPGSIEDVCMQQEGIDFYYPAERLPYNIYPVRDIANMEVLYGKNYTYSLLKADIDGLIFLRTSNPFYQDYPCNMKDYYWDKLKKGWSFLESHGIKYDPKKYK